MPYSPFFYVSRFILREEIPTKFPFKRERVWDFLDNEHWINWTKLKLFGRWWMLTGVNILLSNSNGLCGVYRPEPVLLRSSCKGQCWPELILFCSVVRSSYFSIQRYLSLLAYWPELILFCWRVRASSFWPVSFMLFCRLVESVRARVSSAVLHKVGG
jgi:hypothetical protein